MDYRLRKSEPAFAGCQRVACEEIAIVLQALEACSSCADSTEPVHEARTHLKKLQALLRLLRPFIGEEAYVRERGCFHRAARRLSGLREAVTYVHTLESLREDAPQEALGVIETTHAAFVRELRQHRVPSKRSLEAVAASLEAASELAGEWTFVDCSIEMLCDSATKIYRRGYRAASRVQKSTTTESLHRWRRRTKELWCVLRLLREVHGKRLTRVSRVARDFGETLGADHDLAMLEQAIVREGGPASLSPEDVALLQGLIAAKREGLQRHGWKLAEIVYGKKPHKFQERLLHRWKKWRKK